MWEEGQLSLQRRNVPHPHLCELPQAGKAFHIHKVGSVPMTPDDVNEQLVRVAVRTCISGQVGLHEW